MIHAGVAKLTDFGLTDSAIQRRNSKRRLAYLDSRCIYNKDTKQDQKSDIFSFGVVLWEISSRRRPCDGLQYDNDIVTYRLNGERDAPASGTPEGYIALYSECWDNDAEKRPSCKQILERLSMILQPKATSEHLLSDKLSSIFQEGSLKGRTHEQIANYIKDWLTNNEYINKKSTKEGLL